MPQPWSIGNKNPLNHGRGCVSDAGRCNLGPKYKQRTAGMSNLREILAAGEVALAEGRGKDAFDHMSDAMEIRPGFAPIAEFYLRACLASGKNDNAWQAAEHLALLVPDSKDAADAFRVAGKALDREHEGARRATDIYAAIAKASGGALKSKVKGLFARNAPSPDLACLDAALASDLPAGLKTLLSRARDQLQGGQHEAASRSAAELSETKVIHPAARLLAGIVGLAEGQFQEALANFDAASELLGDHAALRVLTLRAAVQSEKIARAEAIVSGIAEKDRMGPWVMMILAELSQKRGDLAKAHELAAELEKKHRTPEAAVLQARLFAAEGRFEEAAASHKTSAERAPLSGRPFYAAAVERQMVQGTDLFSLAEARLSNPSMAQNERAYIHFALGKALQATGGPDAAFDHFRRGNALMDRWYDPDSEQGDIDALTRHVTAERLGRASANERGKGIVAVCGMPRSGSTLTAQILGRHPGAISIGEAFAFSHCLDVATSAGYPEKIDEIDGAFFEELGDRYLSMLPEAAQDADIVVDKALMTFRDLGLLRLMLPGAKVVHARRDHRDTCFSIYCQRFEGYHGYAYRLDTLAHFAHLHDEIMAHWTATMGAQIQTVEYEDVVENVENAARRILDFAGLDFRPECLDFQKAQGQVTTSSAFQVRQKIYSSSVGAWRRHESDLAVLLEGLKNKPFQSLTEET